MKSLLGFGGSSRESKDERKKFQKANSKVRSSLKTIIGEKGDRNPLDANNWVKNPKWNTSEEFREKWNPFDLGNWVENPDPGGSAFDDGSNSETSGTRNSSGKAGSGPRSLRDEEQLRKIANLEKKVLKLLKYSEDEIEAILELAEDDLKLKKSVMTDIEEIVRGYKDLKWELGKVVSAAETVNQNGADLDADYYSQTWKEIMEKASELEREGEYVLDEERQDLQGIEIEEEEYREFLQEFAIAQDVILELKEYMENAWDSSGIAYRSSGRTEITDQRDFDTVEEMITEDSEDRKMQILNNMQSILEGDHILLEIQERLGDIDKREMEIDQRALEELESLRKQLNGESGEGLIDYINQLEEWDREGILPRPEDTAIELEKLREVITQLEEIVEKLEELKEKEMEDEKEIAGALESAHNVAPADD